MVCRLEALRFCSQAGQRSGQSAVHKIKTNMIWIVLFVFSVAIRHDGKKESNRRVISLTIVRELRHLKKQLLFSLLPSKVRRREPHFEAYGLGS